MQKRIYLVFLIVIIIISIVFLVIQMFARNSRKITFEECANAGGEAWLVDLYHPDICPECDTYRNCLAENSNDSNIFEKCSQVISCSECLNRNHPYPDKCPDGKQKFGEISDASILFQCCK